jgi:hypothetical protein
VSRSKRAAAAPRRKTMKHVIVRYKVKKSRVLEHEELVRGVFRELAETRPAGFRYAAYKQADGVSFVHVAMIESSRNPLGASPAFERFTAKIGERCDEPPVVADAVEVGSYTE